MGRRRRRTLVFARGQYSIPVSWVLALAAVVWLILTMATAVQDMVRELYLFFQ